VFSDEGKDLQESRLKSIYQQAQSTPTKEVKPKAELTTPKQEIEKLGLSRSEYGDMINKLHSEFVSPSTTNERGREISKRLATLGILESGKNPREVYDRIMGIEAKPKAVFKISKKADVWNIPVGPVIQKGERSSYQATKKITSQKIQQIYQDTLTDIEFSEEGDFIVIKGYPIKELTKKAEKALSTYELMQRLGKKGEARIIPKDNTKEYEIDELDYYFERLKDVWFGEKDVRILEANTEAKNFQKRIKDIVGKEGEKYDEAIQIYIDLKNNPDHLKTLYPKDQEKQELVDLSQNLPQEIKNIADDIVATDKAMGLEALEAEVIHNVKENHLTRRWNLKDKIGAELPK